MAARVFSSQLTKKPRQCLVRHITVSATNSSSNNYSSNENSNHEKYSKWSKKLLAISCGIGAGITGFSLLSDNQKCSLLRVYAVSVPVSKRAQFNFIADVVDVAAKSLVYIEIQDTRRMDYHTGKPAAVSNGSGFIVESDGLILTNAHVVINKPRSIVSVRLLDGRIFTGIVEAVDPVSDLATVRIQCKNLPALKLGTSSTLRSGEFVVALGSPLSKKILKSFRFHLKLFHSSRLEQYGNCRRCVVNPTTIRRAWLERQRHKLHPNRRCHHVWQFWWASR